MAWRMGGGRGNILGADVTVAHPCEGRLIAQQLKAHGVRLGLAVSIEMTCDGKRQYNQRVLSTTTAPPFITHRTLVSTTLMSASGSPSTAVMSAK